MNNYAYMLDGKAYINLTNKCHNACTFCIRNTGDGVKGTPLWLDSEPKTAEQVLSAFNSLNYASGEVVFCGYGEPTENLDVLVGVAKQLKRRGYATRLNTNGLGSAVNGKDISPELKYMDVVSVSLNSCTAQKYLDVTRSAYGENAYKCVTDFALACKRQGLNVMFTVVDVIGKADIEECKKLCDGMGIPLRVRQYVSDNYNG